MKGNMTFAARIKKFRETKGESQADLANLVGYRKQAVSHWENNGKVPRSAILEILAKHYQTSSDYLLGFDVAHKSNAADEFVVSSDEMQLLRRYRMMEESQKDVMQKVAETIAPFTAAAKEKR